MEFDFPASITSIWDATIISHTGNHYVIGMPAGIAPSRSAAQRFRSASTAPRATSRSCRRTTFCSNGTAGGAGGGGTGTTNHAPTPVADTLLVNPNQATILNVLANDTDPDGDPLTRDRRNEPATRHRRVELRWYGDLHARDRLHRQRRLFVHRQRRAWGHGRGRGDTHGRHAGRTSTWPAHMYAPYVDVTLYPTYNLVSATQTQGIKYYTLAFITADAATSPPGAATASMKSTAARSTWRCGTSGSVAVRWAAT